MTLAVLLCSSDELARALAMLYEGEEPPRWPYRPKRRTTREIAWGTSREEIRFWEKLQGLLAVVQSIARPVVNSKPQ